MNAHKYERAAREYCKAVGVDPEQQVVEAAKPDSTGFVPAVAIYTAQWQVVARKMASHDLMNWAIKNYADG